MSPLLVAYLAAVVVLALMLGLMAWLAYEARCEEAPTYGKPRAYRGYAENRRTR